MKLEVNNTGEDKNNKFSKNFETFERLYDEKLKEIYDAHLQKVIVGKE